jgi:WD40 repeat protein
MVINFNIGKLEGHSNPVSCLAFSPDDKFLCSGSEDKSLFLWDLQTK